MVAPAPQPTPEELIESLAEAGELDAGAEVLDALRLRDPERSLVRLQARLFDAPDAPDDVARRAALAPWRAGGVAQLQQGGAFLEAAVALRVLARVFADEPALAEAYARAEALLAPLPNPLGDPARAAFDGAIARGDAPDAWDRITALARRDPGDPSLAARVALLREVLGLPVETPPPAGRPEPVDASSLAALAARLPQRLKAGDLAAALRDADALAAQPQANPRWARFRDALGRLVARAPSASPEASDDGLTARTGPVERFELWLRAGNLGLARDALRQQLPKAPPLLAADIEACLADLDTVLDTTLPTPVPPRPATPVETTVPREPLVPEVSPAGPLTLPAGTDDTERARPALSTEAPPLPPSEHPAPAAPAPAPAAPAPAPAPASSALRVGKRKIVQLK